MTPDGARTWSLTGSPRNDAGTGAHGVAVTDCKERRRAPLMDGVQAAAGVSA